MFTYKYKKSIFLLLRLFIPVIMVMSSQGVAMPFFSKQEQQVVICSPMEGIITYKGKPVSGAKVERWLKWKDEKGERDTVQTDKSGHFSLPIIEDTVSLSPISQFVMGQEIKVFHNDHEYEIWSIGKSEKGIYGELGGEPENFRCELTDEGIPHRLENSLLFTSCKWDQIK